MSDAPPETGAVPEESPPAIETPAKEKPAKPAGTSLSVLALIIALGAAGMTGYQWYKTRGEDRALRQELAQRLADIESRSTEAGARVNQATAALREAEIKLGLLEAKLAESQNQQIALEALYQELSRNRDEWSFADIEQSVLLASQQLQIAGNVRAALIGLENA
jgi:uroporphyrin-3 C-methyltransferase